MANNKDMMCGICGKVHKMDVMCEDVVLSREERKHKVGQKDKDEK